MRKSILGQKAGSLHDAGEHLRLKLQCFC